jgi:hypothetical protein
MKTQLVDELRAALATVATDKQAAQGALDAPNSRVVALEAELVAATARAHDLSQQVRNLCGAETVHACIVATGLQNDIVHCAVQLPDTCLSGVGVGIDGRKDRAGSREGHIAGHGP